MISFFLRRPLLTIVLFIFQLILGFVALQQLSIDEEPQIVENVYLVNISHAATIDQLEQNIVKILEPKLISIPGVEMVTANIGNNNIAFQLYFAPENQHIENMLNIYNVISEEASHSLPPTARHTIHLLSSSATATGAEAISVVFSSAVKDERSLFAFIRKNILNELMSINGVSNAVIVGDQENSFDIQIMSDRLLKYKISTNAVMDAINNFLPASNTAIMKIDNHLIQVEARFHTVNFRSIPVANSEGHIYKLSDVADIKLSSSRPTIQKLDGGNVVRVKVFKRDTANLLTTCRDLRIKMKEIENMCAAHQVTTSIFEDKSVNVNSGISSVYSSIVEAILLVIIVIWLFLRSFRASLIVAIAIPCSVIPMLMILYATKSSLNIYSLFGILLSIGLVVDDAIVIIENIFKYIEKGYKVDKASLEGTRTILGSVVSMTITLAVVYLPILLVNDQSIRRFLEFAISIASSVLFSGLVSILLTPTLFNLICSNVKADKHSDNDFLSRVEKLYIYALNFVIRIRYLFLAVSLFILSVSIAFLLNVIPTEEDIAIDRSTMIFVLQNKPGKTSSVHSLSYIDSFNNHVVNEVKKHAISKDIRHIFTTAVNQYESNGEQSTLIVKLKDKASRKHSLKQIEHAIVDIGSQAVKDIDLYLHDTSSSTDVRYKFGLQVFNSTTAQNCEDAIVHLYHQYLAPYLMPGGFQNHDLRSSTTYNLELNTDYCTAHGVSPTNIIQTLSHFRDMVYQTKPVATDVNKIFLRLYTKNEIEKLHSMMNLPIDVYTTDKRGQKVKSNLPIGNFIKLTTASTPVARYHIDGINGVPCTVKLKSGLSKKQFLNILNDVNTKVNKTMKIKSFPSELRKIKTMEKVYALFFLAVMLIYLILVAQFESLIAPFAILVTVPLAALGALLFLFIIKCKINVISIIGIITLVGLIIKHGIMIIDYVVRNDNRTYTIDYIVCRACLNRFRPIIMTTICMVIGALPLLRSATVFSEYKIPIAATIIGGMSLGTLLTLFILPCIYIILLELFRARRVGNIRAELLYNTIKYPSDED